MNPDLLPSEEIIISKTYTLRKQKVMLDADLAKLYGVETKQLKRQVKRNIERFPKEFMFELTENELNDLRSQFGTSSWGGTRYLPYAFTEHSILMLSSVLNSDIAIQINIYIIRVFTRFRELLMSNNEILIKIEQLDKRIISQEFDLKMHDGEIETIFSLIQEILAEKTKPIKPKDPIGFIRK